MKCARANASRPCSGGRHLRCARKWRTRVGLGAMERSGVWGCTKMTISCEEIVFDTPNSMKMGNNSVRFRFEWDIIGTVKSTIGSTSSFLHNLSSFLYRVGIGKAWATLGARRLGLQCANIKKAAGKGSMLFPAAWPGRRLQRRRPVSFPGPTLLAEVHSVPPLAHQEPRALRPLSAPQLQEPRRVRRTAGISLRSRHRTHSGTSCKSARPLSSMLV